MKMLTKKQESTANCESVVSTPVYVSLATIPAGEGTVHRVGSGILHHVLTVLHVDDFLSPWHVVLEFIPSTNPSQKSIKKILSGPAGVGDKRIYFISKPSK